MVQAFMSELEFPLIFDLGSSVPIVKLYSVSVDFHCILSKTYAVIVWWSQFLGTIILILLFVVLKILNIVTFWYLSFCFSQLSVSELYTFDKTFLKCIIALENIRIFNNIFCAPEDVSGAFEILFMEESIILKSYTVWEYCIASSAW